MKPIKIYAEILEPEALKQFEDAMSLDCVVAGALMPDAHTGYSLPIGAVVAVKDHISPAFVGYDIGCGMSAIKLNLLAETINRVDVFNAIIASTPIGFTQYNEPQDYPEPINVSNIILDHLETKGKFQIGTLGGGNHFIELGVGQDGYLWIIIHSGSRNIGHSVAEYYMKLAAFQSINFDEIDLEFEGNNLAFKQHNPEGFQKALIKNREKIKVNPEGQHLFHVDSPIAKSYINDLQYCLEYALKNRELMMNKIVKILGNPEQLMFINRNHNHAEFKDGLWIHRKGATHAEKGMLGVIPGNMRDGSFIVKGKGNQDSLCSSSHGAGRVLSRTKALSTLNYEDFINSMQEVTTNISKSTLDEAPLAYKSIFEVMELQKDLVEVIDYVKPIINIKG